MAYATLAQLKTYLGIKNSDTFTADAATDILTLTDTAIDWTTGDEVVLTTTAADLPNPLAVSTVYYVIYSSPLAIKLATTKANADAGTNIDITDAGTGTHTITKAVTDDSLLSDLLDRITAKIELYTGRVFTAASATRYFGRDALDPKNRRILWMDDDLQTITTLTNGDSDDTVILAADYVLIDRNAGPPYYGIQLIIDTSTSWEFDTDKWVSVLGTWGYTASGSEPADIVDACVEWAAYAYRKRDAPFLEAVGFEEGGVITIPQGMPASVKMALDPYKRKVRY
jgi:hypothetical protein